MKTSISEYYDRNTRRFLRFSPTGSASTIHRAVWAPGVTNRTQAVHYVHDLLLGYGPDQQASPRVWDLGCGVGASMMYLASRKAGSYRGLTISRVQQALATRSIKTLTKATIRVDLADFCDPLALEELCLEGKPDLVYMIESLVHGTCAPQLLKTLADALRPGGRLIICDDLLSAPQALDDPWVQRFRQGWGIETLLTPKELEHLVGTWGLEILTNLNLTPYVENNRPRDRLIRGLIRLADKTGFSTGRLAQKPFWQNMFGGDALQQATSQGNIEYRFLVFEKPIDTTNKLTS